VGIDFQTDLAVLKIEETGLPTLPLGDWADVQQGDLVFAFGAPRGLDNSMTMGVVSSPMRQFTPDYPMVYIQTDTPINPGNSGGPLVNINGEVVGLNTMIFSEGGGSEGIGFALPSLVVDVVYEKIREKGWFPRGDIGIATQTITNDMETALSLSQDWGAIVSDVHPQGPAAQQRVQIGDIIVAVDNAPVDNGLAVSWRISQKAVGETVRLDILRDGRRVPATVRVTERPGDEFKPRLGAVTSEDNLILRLGIMGVDIQSDAPDILPMIRRDFGTLVVVASNPRSGASIGLAAGDVIYSVNGRDMETLADLKRTVNALRSGDPMVLQVERGGRLAFLTTEVP
jgi:serine protease Do